MPMTKQSVGASRAVQHATRRVMRRVMRRLALPGTALVMAVAIACSPSSLVDVQAPGLIVDPAQVTTPTAAIQMRTAALAYVAAYLGGVTPGSNVVVSSGLFTDELAETGALSVVNGSRSDIGARSGTSSMTVSEMSAAYRAIHTSRVLARQAREALVLYASNRADAPRAWQGELYALEGYAVLWLAELYCSGIPLTSVPLVGVQQPTRGFTTEELFARASVLFDSAMVFGADSARFVSLARVGKGRAELGLGHFAAADSAVQSVPSDFVYLVQFTPSGSFINGIASRRTGNGIGMYRAQDREGGSPMVWSGDPRTAIVTLPTRAGAMLWPAKYYVTASGALNPTVKNPGMPVRLADGLEAQLIHAEAALAVGGDWLATLNTLRSTCVGSTPCAPVPSLSALPALTDPGSADARLDLLMQERALWLYMTGHREGDLRRLAHIYHRDPTTLWPHGTISAPAFSPLYTRPLAMNGTAYGTATVFLPDSSDVQYTPGYAGCYDQNP